MWEQACWSKPLGARPSSEIWGFLKVWMGFPGGTSGKEATCQCRRCKRCGFDLCVRKIPQRRAWQLTPVFLPEEFCEQARLQPGQLQSLGWQRVGTTEATQHKARKSGHIILNIKGFVTQKEGVQETLFYLKTIIDSYALVRNNTGTLLVVQWLTIPLLMQGTQV